MISYLSSFMIHSSDKYYQLAGSKPCSHVFLLISQVKNCFDSQKKVTESFIFAGVDVVAKKFLGPADLNLFIKTKKIFY